MVFCNLDFMQSTWKNPHKLRHKHKNAHKHKVLNALWKETLADPTGARREPRWEPDSNTESIQPLCRYFIHTKIIDHPGPFSHTDTLLP